jgi:hypothetical protein
MEELAQEELRHAEWLKDLKGKGVEKLTWHRERAHKVEDEAVYDPTNKALAFAKAQERGKRITIGVIYREERSTSEEQLPALIKGLLVMQKIEPRRVEELRGELV